MIIGAHCVVSSTDPKVDLAFLRDVLKLPSVDDGGYVIFGLPAAEVSVHEGDTNDVHQLFQKRSIACAPVQDQGWGLLTELSLPGGGKLSVYQPRHKRPKSK